MKSAAKEQRAHELEAAQMKANLKAFFKSSSKNELIKMLFEQIELYQDLQQLAKQLHEENQKLKPVEEVKNEA